MIQAQKSRSVTMKQDHYVDTKKADKKVTISTIDSIQAKLRKIHKLKVKDGWSLEAIMIPKIKLRLKALDIPEVWQELEGVWAEQDTYDVSAQILLGADQARFFPHEARDEQGALLQTDNARLMQSEITGNFIIFGSCGRLLRQMTEESRMQMNQIQATSLNQEDDEVLISIMDTMLIEERGSHGNSARIRLTSHGHLCIGL